MSIHKDLPSNSYLMTLPFQIRDFLMKEGVPSVFLEVKEKDSSAVLTTDLPDGDYDTIDISIDGQLFIPGKLANIIKEYCIFFKFNQREFIWSLKNSDTIHNAGYNSEWILLLELAKSLKSLDSCQKVIIEDESIVLESFNGFSSENITLLTSKMERLVGKELLVELYP